jgi:hypothetical protein
LHWTLESKKLNTPARFELTIFCSLGGDDDHYTMPPGANPTIANYNTSAVKIYNAGNSLAHFKSKNYFFLRFKNALAYYNPGVVVAISKVVRLAPE